MTSAHAIYATITRECDSERYSMTSGAASFDRGVMTTICREYHLATVSHGRRFSGRNHVHMTIQCADQLTPGARVYESAGGLRYDSSSVKGYKNLESKNRPREHWRRLLT